MRSFISFDPVEGAVVPEESVVHFPRRLWKDAKRLRFHQLWQVPQRNPTIRE